nr:hypothetical protein CFP56_63112 [Quercus suber]
MSQNDQHMRTPWIWALKLSEYIHTKVKSLTRKTDHTSGDVSLSDSDCSLLPANQSYAVFAIRRLAAEFNRTAPTSSRLPSPPHSVPHRPNRIRLDTAMFHLHSRQTRRLVGLAIHRRLVSEARSSGRPVPGEKAATLEHMLSSPLMG